MSHAYTEDQLIEQPANPHRRRDPAAEGLPRLLSGQVEVSESNVKTGAPAA